MSAPPPKPRGPPGTAPPPPASIEHVSLPILTIDPTQDLVRIHQSTFDPVFFGPVPREQPLHRFDCASGRFGVLYLGLTFQAAFAETVLRNPQLPFVRLSEIAARSCSRLKAGRALRVARLHDYGLAALGLDNAIATGPYEPCAQWSDALWDHPDLPDGIAYRSRHDPEQICLAVFERPGIVFDIAGIHPLMSRQREIGALLDRSAKSLLDDLA